jgi:hypothetical protein
VDFNKFLEGKISVKTLLENDISRGIRATNSLADNIKNLYEVDWKLFVVSWNIRDRGGFGPAVKRFRNIKQRLQRKGRKVADQTADQLLGVFNDWLNNHALLSAERWAESHLEDRFMQNQLDQGNYEMVVDTIKGIAEPSPVNIDLAKAFKDFLIDQGMTRNIELVVQEDIAQLPADDPTYEKLNQAVKNDDIETIAEHYREVMFIGGGTQAELENVFSMFVRDPEDYFKFLLMDQVFQSWKDYWVQRGIKETREQVEQARNKLENVESKSVQEAIGIINQALNTSHQSGPMMDYINGEYPDVTERFLSQLTDGEFLDEWRQDIVDARMSLPPNPDGRDMDS